MIRMCVCLKYDEFEPVCPFFFFFLKSEAVCLATLKYEICILKCANICIQ